MTSPGPNRFFDDMARLMTNAMGVAQGAKDEAETAFKGWVDRWLAERDFVTREEFEAVREMAIKARTENAELRALIGGMGGSADASAPGGAPAQAPHVSQADAPAADMTSPDAGKAEAADAPHVSQADAPAADMGAAGTTDAGKAGAADAPHVSQADAPPADMEPAGKG